MSAQQITPTRATILVVEDDADTRQFLIDLLTFEGYRVLDAESGGVALTCVAEEQVDGVVLDLRLPDIDGYTVCRRIRASEQGDLPVLVVSAEREVASKVRAREAGATDYLVKPFLPDALLGRLRALLPRMNGMGPHP